MSSIDPREFRIPYDYISPYLDGVYLAVNAMPDSYLVYDAHDCGYYKASKIAGNHDLFSDLMRWDRMNRVVRTDLDSREYIMGSEDKLSMKIRQVADRYRPDVVIVVRSNIVITAGHDAEPVVRDLARKIEAPVVLLSDKSVEGDFVSGFLQAVEALLPHVELESVAEDRRSVCVAGYLYSRNEGDDQGNVKELERMLVGIGAAAGPVLLSGRPWRDWRSMSSPGTVVDLASGWVGARRLAERAEARYLPAPLPMGLQGTCTWLRAVAATLAPPCDPEPFIDAELRALVPTLQWILPRYFFGRCAMVFADRLILQPLVEFVEELGLRVTAVGSTSASAEDQREAPPLLGGRYPIAPRFTDELEAFIAERRRHHELDLIIGNGFIHQIAESGGVPCVELGYPCRAYHALRPSPFAGFAGMRVLVERMINALERGGLAPAGE